MQTPPTIARIDARAGLQRRVWTASRIAWQAMVAVLLLAAGGAFGDGPLAEAEASAPDGTIRVAYDRFQRSDAGSTLDIRLRGGQDGEARFCLDHAFGRAWQVTLIEPAALREEMDAGGTCHVVALTASPPEAPLIRLRVHPRHAALRTEGRLYVPGGDPVSVRALVWP